MAASPATGVNTLTGEGLDDALKGTQVVVDVANGPNFADGPILDFFLTAGRNLLKAEAAAGVGRHIALTIVGSERLLDSGYMRAKLAQESLIRAFASNYTILRATQFFEFLAGITDQATTGDIVRLSPALIQPMAASDVAEQLAELTFQPDVKGIVEIGGPQTYPLCELGQRLLVATGDKRRVVADAEARYFGALLGERSLLPGADASMAPIHFEEWLADSIRPVAVASVGR